MVWNIRRVAIHASHTHWRLDLSSKLHVPVFAFGQLAAGSQHGLHVVTAGVLLHLLWSSLCISFVCLFALGEDTDYHSWI